MKLFSLRVPLKKTIIFVSTVIVMTWMTSSSVSAWDTSDPWWREWEASTFEDFKQKVDDQLDNLESGLSDIYDYLSDGSGDNGKGWIGTLMKIWTGKQAFKESTNKNLAQMDRVTATDAAVSKRSAQNMPDPRKCDELPKTLGARAAGGGGAKYSSKGKFEFVMAQNAGGTARNSAEKLGDMYGTHTQNKYCAPSDVKYANGEDHSAFGCTNASAAAMPDADARVQSLFVPAHNFMNTSEAKVQNLTFNTEQTQAAVDASKNIVSSFAPIALSADMEKTPSGKAYLSLVKALNARLSPAIHALASIASAREPLAALPAYLQDSWAIASSGVMSRIFPGMNPVTNPSDAEVMRFEVMRRYADFGTDSWHNKLIQDNDESNLWLEYNTTQAVNAYIEYELHQRYEESNALNAAILAQRVNPITEEMVRSAATSVMANKK